MRTSMTWSIMKRAYYVYSCSWRHKNKMRRVKKRVHKYTVWVQMRLGGMMSIKFITFAGSKTKADVS